VARNRKRAKERRARRPQPVVGGRNDREEGAPPAIEHAAPDAELAEAQLAVGRQPIEGESEEDREASEEELYEEEAESEEELTASSREIPGVTAATPQVESGDGAGATVGEAALAAPRAVPGNKLINFLQGSWRELQRVQWPDRRQVIQATGVVIGFVIVAGAFLGVADFLAGKLIDAILK
jgi:preprotein translocase subunit SecE